MALSKNEASGIRQEAQKKEFKPVEAKPKSKKRVILFSAIFVFVLILSGVVFSYVNSKKPSPLDGFAKCLTEKNAIMYGASWCKYTQAQKRMFGNSFRFVNYKDFSENPEVKITPTWFINGKKYENAQSFDKLAAVTGCSIQG